MEITLLRHAPTRGNLLRQYLGSTDEPLAPEGVRMVQRHTQPDPEVLQVYTSPLRRSGQTAALLYPAAQHIAVPQLAEMDFGIFEGKNWQELQESAAYQSWLDTACTSPCPGGEGQAGFIKRCTSSFQEIVQTEAKRDAQHLHFVLHGGSLMAILSQLATPVQEYFCWRPAFCGGWVLQYHPHAPRPLEVVRLVPGFQRPSPCAHR